MFLDLAKAYDSTWIPGLILKLREIGVDGSCLKWLTNFLQSRSFRVLIGQTASEPRDLLAGVPQGSPLSPTLFNIMLYDFPKPQLPVKTLLYADDIETHVSTNSYRDAEDKLQPYLDKIVRWCSKWKLKLSYEKCVVLPFINSSRPPPEPLLFLASHRIQQVSNFKFLGVWFDQRVTWKKHIADVATKCSRIKNIFLFLSSRKFNVSSSFLTQLFKSLIQSRIDYGLIVYGTAAKSNLVKLDITARQILRIILGAVKSTPTPHLHAELGIPETGHQHEWLLNKFAIRLSNTNDKPIFKAAQDLIHQEWNWPPRRRPALDYALSALDQPALFDDSPAGNPASQRPQQLPPMEIRRLPITKQQATSSSTEARAIFQEWMKPLRSSGVLEIYTDGSLNYAANRTSCAVWIPTLNLKKSWQLTPGSSVYSAELLAILKALELVYSLDQYFEQILIISDSAASVSAIQAQDPSHPATLEIHNTGVRVID